MLRNAHRYQLIALLCFAPGLLWAQAVQPRTDACSFAGIHAQLEDQADAVLHASATKPASVPQQPDSIHTSAALTPPIQRGRGALSRFGSVIAPILQREGVPADLVAVVQVESGGNPYAVSSKGAVGLWQLMPDTARRYGLAVSSSHDERLDLAKSTETAARYLRDLYTRFGSWPLALAAYNAGEHNVQRAIEKAHTSDFASLRALRLLPAETRDYVPAVLAGMHLQSSVNTSTPHGLRGRINVIFAPSEPSSAQFITNSQGDTYQ